MKTYYLKGIVRAEEPLTVSLKSSGTGHRLPRNGGFKAKPYMPATSFRGALRHACHVALNRHIVETTGEKLSLQQHFMLAQGVDINGSAMVFGGGEIDGSLALRKANPFISLWGRWGLGGHMSVGNMYPIQDDCVADFGGGNRSVMFERNTNLLSYLSETEVSELNRILKEQSSSSEDIKPIKSQIQTLTKSLKTLDDAESVAKVKEKIAELESQISEIKDAKEGPRESIRRPIDSYEAFVAGCEFNHRFAVQCANETELGLLLAALHEFSRSPYLGGHRSHNCGLISADYVVSIYPEGADAHIPVGRVAFSDEGFIVEGSELTSARASWKLAELDLSNC
jgi:CRISPR type IV-associated protein Csf2